MTSYDTDLTGRVALVTGAGQGVGLGIARALAHAGAGIGVLDIDGPRAEAAAAGIAALGVTAVPLVADVSDRAQVDDAVARLVDATGRLDIVVNNAHTVIPGRVLDIDEAALETMWGTCFLGTFNVCHAVRPHLGAGASVINIVSSVMLKTDTSGFALYAATKIALRSLTRTLAMEWGSDGIRVNALSPQTTSPAWEAWSAANVTLADSIRGEIPLRYLGDPETDVGPVAVFLASDASRYVTGSVVLADGGRGHLR